MKKINLSLCAAVALFAMSNSASAYCSAPADGPAVLIDGQAVSVQPCHDEAADAFTGETGGMSASEANVQVEPEFSHDMPSLIIRPLDPKYNLIRLNADFLFDTGKSEIKPEYKAELDVLGYELKVNRQMTVRIEGRTDSVGSKRYNEKLSVERAEAVRQALESRGVRWYSIETAGFGEMSPVAGNDTADGRQLNRRADAAVEYGGR